MDCLPFANAWMDDTPDSEPRPDKVDMNWMGDALPFGEASDDEEEIKPPERTAEEELCHWIREGDEKVVRTMLMTDVDVHARDRGGGHALKYAVESKNVNMVAMVLNAGADMEVPDVSGNKALHFAVRSGCPKVLALLLKYGANVNMVNKERRTALHMAILEKKEKMVIGLVVSGANVHMKDGKEMDAMDMAVRKRSEGVIRLLLRHGGKVKEQHHWGKMGYRLKLLERRALVPKLTENVCREAWKHDVKRMMRSQWLPPCVKEYLMMDDWKRPR